MALQWIAVSARTGEVIADLPGLVVDWPLKRTINRYDTATAHLPLAVAPENWADATRVGGVNLVALDDEQPDSNGQPMPVWGGMVTYTDVNSGPTVDLSLATLEAYLDGRYVGDYSATRGQCLIASDLVTKAAEGALPGIPVRVEIWGGDGTVRTVAWKDSDDVTIYSALQQLAGQAGGIEFTVEWEWQHNPERLTPVFHVGDRIGTPVPEGLNAQAVFEMPGCTTEVHVVSDFSKGRGANDVTARGVGQGDTRPSFRDRVSGDDRPTVEFRYQPVNSAADDTVLAAHVAQALSVLGSGSRALTLTCDCSDGSAPMLGRDWVLGDDIGFNLVAPAWPRGIAGVARCIGWERSATEVTPIIPAPEVFTEAS